MGIGDIFGGGTKKQKSTVEVEYPEWVKRGSRKAFRKGFEAATRKYPHKRGKRKVQGFKPDTREAWKMARANEASWRPAWDLSMAEAAESAGHVTQEDIDRYLNPYQKYVTDEMWRANERSDKARHGGWAHSGSYLNEANRATIDAYAEGETGRQVGMVNKEAFDTALGQANTDRERAYRAALYYLKAGEDASRLGYTDAAVREAIGGKKEAKGQQRKDTRWENFMREFMYPQNQMDYVANLLARLPYGRTETTTGQVPTSNIFGQVAGAGLAAAGTAGALGWQPFAAGAAPATSVGAATGPPTSLMPWTGQGAY